MKRSQLIGTIWKCKESVLAIHRGVCPGEVIRIGFRESLYCLDRREKSGVGQRTHNEVSFRVCPQVSIYWNAIDIDLDRTTYLDPAAWTWRTKTGPLISSFGQFF
ncbi:MAG: hypothetical protein IT425_12860 [Pirellulales bacterium]|nr:hypothetical protein [Pirellulales bacterium]